MELDEEFTGEKLLGLVLAIEHAVGGLMAGATPLGSAVITLCEDAMKKDKEKAA